MTVFIAVLF